MGWTRREGPHRRVVPDQTFTDGQRSLPVRVETPSCRVRVVRPAVATARDRNVPVTAALLIGPAWLVVATVVALVLARGLHVADMADERVGRELRAEVDAVLAGLEADLRAAAASHGRAA